MPEWLASPSGEIGTKRPGTQKELKLLLAKNLKARTDSLGLSFRWEEKEGRFLVEGQEELLPFLVSLFGLSKVSFLLRLPRHDPWAHLDLSSLLPERPFVYTVYVKRFSDQEAKEAGLTFKRELLFRLGEMAQERLKQWDNHPPEEVSWQIEVYPQEFWLLWKRLPAPGGLPVGCGEKVLVLFSGGPDSLLAAYLLARRGQEIELVFLDDGEPGRFELVKKAAQALAFFLPGLEIRLWRGFYRPVLEKIKELVPRRERCFFCRRLMAEASSALFSKTGAKALATGEILGEQASQTLTGLLFSGAEFPLLRPVLAFNKEEVFQKLEAAGLAKVARLPLPPCPFAPERPRTRPTKPRSLGDRLSRKLKKLRFEVHLLRYQT